MKHFLSITMLFLSACASTFESSTKAPDATPLQLRGQKVAAMVIAADMGTRRRAEDVLAQEITRHGAQGVATYTLLPEAKPTNEKAMQEALEKAGVQGVVTMRPISVENKVSIEPATHLDATHSGFWNGYYGQGWSMPYTAAPVTVGTDIRPTTVVFIESRVYSFKQNKLVWSGQSKTVDPPKLEEFVRKLAADIAAELEAQGLIKK